MAYVESYAALDRHEALRWASCGAAVFAAHALLLLALSVRPDDAEIDSGTPVVLIELAPLAVAPPAPQTDLAPGPQQLQTESRQEMREETPQEKPEELERLPDVTPAPDPVVTLPSTPEPPKQTPPKHARQEPAEAAPVPTARPAARPANRPASPAPGRVQQPSPAALASWQRALVAQLERNKRYPPQAGGIEGVARLAFRLDRRGQVLASRIVQSSGSAALDGETLALVRRAQPFPPPPANIADAQLAFVVPIRYAAKR